MTNYTDGQIVSDAEIVKAINSLNENLTDEYSNVDDAMNDAEEVLSRLLYERQHLAERQAPMQGQGDRVTEITAASERSAKQWKIDRSNPVTNPLEQIRDLADEMVLSERDLDEWQRHFSDELLAILAANKGYVCVPVEVNQKSFAFDALVAAGRISDEIYEKSLQLARTMLAASKETNRE